MTDTVPILPTLAEPPRRERQIVVTAALSVLLHLLLLAWILLPRTNPPEPAEPQSVNVELVPPSALSSLDPPSSSAAPSSLPPPASSDAAASSAEPPSSAEPSAAAASSGTPASSAAASEVPSASASAPPVPPARPVVIPVGPSEASSAAASASEDTSEAASAEASSAPSEAGSSVLATASPDADGNPDAVTATTEDLPPPPAGALHAAKRFYLEAMLSAPAMAAARKALKTLPPEKRIAQTCNIEAIAQIGNAGRGYAPDALVASAFAAPVIAGTSYDVGNGAFRSKQKWHGVAYHCTLSKDLSAVTAFTFHFGADVTDAMLARFGGKSGG